MQLETIAVHAGRQIDRATGAVSVPLHLSTTFERDADGGFSRSYEYSRDDNPNRRSLETCLAALEGGSAAVAFPSGMAAIASTIETLSAQHDGRLLLPKDMYFGIRSLLADTAFGRGLDVALVDMTDLSAVEAACREGPPAIVWIETPSNPLVSIVDIAGVAEFAHAFGAAVVVDNTWATPLLQRPFDLGADLSIHSLTKYIGGHSDVMAGAVVVKEDGPCLRELRAIQRNKGVLAAPFDCWLALRGAASLSARMSVHCANAMAIAQFLEGQAAVTKVHYPGLPSHAGHAIATRQMRAYGGMLSFEVRGDRADAMAIAAALRVITRATSLGGNHSLIEHRESVEGSQTMAAPTLLRLSVGLENIDDLLADLDAALGAI